ncbi:MAG: DUF4153 domain-containing protein [Erysipelotrichaceae bacterium]|nr:DUF4153 domain-containing protein [Erysipelotrichaceae bacterium]
MKNLFDRLKNALGRMEGCIRRFPFSFVYLCLITLAGSYLIISENEEYEMMAALVFGGLSCFLLELAYEYGIHRFRPVSPVLSFLIGALVFWLLKKHQNEYVDTAVFAMAPAIVSLICYVLYRNRENRKLFSHLIKSLFIVQVFTAVILAGFSVCIAAFHFLIFGFSNIWKFYGILFLSVTALFSITLFLSYVPGPKEEVEVSETYRTMIHKALFYIYLILIGILYLYILKIIITWKMPVGKLNWFGSFALLFYVFFYLSINETDGNIQTLFKKYGAYLLIPVLAIQLFAIVIRLDAYGLTTARFLSLILIGIAVGFMLSNIFRFSPSWCFLLIPAVLVLFTCTPLNIYDVPNRVQEGRLKEALTKGGALVNDSLDESVELETEYWEDAKSAFEYLRWSDGKKSAFYETFAQTQIAKSFYEYGYEKTNVRSFYYSNDFFKEYLDISGYQTMRRLTNEDTDLYPDDLRDFLLGLEQTENDEETLVYELSDGNRIVFENISYDYDLDSGEFLYLYWRGILLSK